MNLKIRKISNGFIIQVLTRASEITKEYMAKDLTEIADILKEIYAE